MYSLSPDKTLTYIFRHCLELLIFRKKNALKSDSGMFEEGGEQCFRMVDRVDGGTGGQGQIPSIGREEIGKFNVFDPLPTLFDRVEFRAVRRKILEVEPVWMFIGKRFGYRIMQRQVVPEQNDFAAIEKMQLPKQVVIVVPGHAAGQERVAKVDVAAMRRDRDEADAGRSLTTGCFKQDRRFTERRPSGTTIRRK